jgi:hypothetical protein
MKNEHATILGRLGGLRGGPARAKILSPLRRQQIARKAAKSRWNLKLHNDRVYRTAVAAKVANETGLDAGDIEHALYNLTIEPLERLRRGLTCRRP